jgi:uncharacterized membrane protein
MNEKEILQQRLQELLTKADSYISEINQLKELIREVEKKEIENEVIENQIVPPVIKKHENKEPYIPPVINPVVQQKAVVPPTQQYYPQQKPVQKKSNIEKYIGENLINKIGIAILVLGIGFFVKYAIDKNWINEVARMFIGIAAGFTLIGIGYFLRKKYRAFCSVLTGGGVAVLYFSFFIAFREYEILTQTVTFILMIVVTIFTVFLSVWYDRRELAIIGIIGGFASPLMISTGVGNYMVLFSYLFILNAGMLVLAYYKNWTEINIISFFFTILFFGSWLLMNVLFESRDPYEGALFFGTLFYLQFFCMNIINAFKESRKFGVFEIIMLTSNTFLYYTAGMVILYQITYFEFNGIFTAMLGIFNLGFALALYKNQSIDKVLRFLLIGFAITFISLIAPVQFDGNFITLFWATEFVILYWLAWKSDLPILKIFSGSVFLVVLMSLWGNWVRYYGFFNTDNLPVIFNKAFLTGMFVDVTILVNIWLIKIENIEYSIPGIPSKVYRSILIALFAFVMYLVIFLELNYQLPQYVDALAVRRVIGFSFTAVFFYSLLLYLRKRSHPYVVWSFTGVLFIVTFTYLLSSHPNTVIIRNYCLVSESGDLWAFYYHYINVAVVVASLFLILKIIKEKLSEKIVLVQLYLWYLCGMLIFIVTSELDHLTVINYYTSLSSIPEILRQNGKIGYPIIWGISALIIMISGLRKRNTMLRIISLSVFGIIILKLFIFDIREMPAGGKTAAFIILGVILLLVSFLYQKLKKVVFGDESEEEHK